MIIDKNVLNCIVDPLLNWYDECKRDLPWRHNPTPYRVWISEIMLQQTRVDPVIPYYLRFMDAFPTVHDLAIAPEDVLMKYWEGLGYYSRARNLQKAAKEIDAVGDFPKDYDGWLKLPGIGAYTAGAICSIALGLPIPAVDGNVLRVLSRVLGSKEDIASDSTKKEFTAALKCVYPQGKTSEFTQSLMELGATVCLPNGAPLCDQCPLNRLCFALKNDLINEIPVKAPKKKRTVEKRTVLILRCGDKFALSRRNEKGLLAKMWEFPNITGHLSTDRVADFLNTLKPIKIEKIGKADHIFSHIEWHMDGYFAEVGLEDKNYYWFTVEEILENIAIPSAFRFYLNYLKDLRYKEI